MSNPNRLAAETSPYLLQHAQNPVDWFAWRPEAFEKARDEDKPILVSIGYSTCHWCHVMERESFEDESTAALMNELFVCIKVDREERPDVDQIYMEACQIVSGGGGWPLNCFLLPDGRPFYAGTYWPPAPAHGRPSWRQVLLHIAKIWRTQRSAAEEQAQRLMASIERSDRSFLKPGEAFELKNEALFTSKDFDSLFSEMQERMDSDDGGFGGAPKFPSSMALRFLLDHAATTRKPAAAEHVFFTLKKMIGGGIWDQLGGGFARYSTDAAWRAPHFEKMLYDNALLMSAMAEGLKFLQSPFAGQHSSKTLKNLLKTAIIETFEWLSSEMTDPNGGFFSAQDADSEGEEGKFFVWKKPEFLEALGDDDGPLMAEFFGIEDSGNWERGQNILWRPLEIEAFCTKKSLDRAVFDEKMRRCRQRLFEIRSARTRPSLDDKIILGWNGLMASGLCKAFEATADRRFFEAAQRALDFVFEKMASPSGGFYHVFSHGKGQYEAFLEDLAALAAACLDFYEVSFDRKWLDRAAAIADRADADFWDAETSTYFFASEKQSDLVARRRDLFDNATPSGNSTMATVQQRLGVHFGDEKRRERARSMLAAMRETVFRYPLSFARWASAMLFEAFPAKEIAVVGPSALETARRIGALFLPNRALAASQTGDDGLPLLAYKMPVEGLPDQIFLCENHACRAPFSSVEALSEAIY